MARFSESLEGAWKEYKYRGEYMDNFAINDKVYIIRLNTNSTEPGGVINPKNYEVVEVKIIGIYKDEIKVEFENSRRKRIKNGKYYKYEIEAQQSCYKIANEMWRKQCAEKIQTSPPEQLLPNIIPRYTGNPLRFAERNIGFGAQTNVWGSEINEQKIIQIIAMTFEDIEMIMGILDVLGFMNDYAKKLLGKYLIIELSSLYNLLGKLKDLNKEYKINEFNKLVNSIMELEKKYKFKFIRDKIAAHKDCNIDIEKYTEIWNAINHDSLNEYWLMLVKHIDEILMKYYQHEKTMYFLLRKQSMNGFIALEDKGDNYTPFSGIEV